MKNIITGLRRLHGFIHELVHKKENMQNMRMNVIHKQQKCAIKVLDIDDTLDELEKGKSMSRFGDGEMEIILGNDIGFQKRDLVLGKRLAEILLAEPDDRILLCVPDALVTLNNLTDTSIEHWVQNMTQHHDDWMKYLKTDYAYGNTNVTRCYMRYLDKKNSINWFKRLQNLWTGENVVLVEGFETRVGIGNDMLDNAKSIKRILCPSENAFDKYNDIKEYIINNISKDDLILIALGPTATLLSWDLVKNGYRTLDIGHCDIEYSWCKMGVKTKTVVDGKYTNEVSGGNKVNSIIDEKYNKEILVTII